MYLLGVDIGSYSTKGVLLSEAGEVVAVAVQPHEMRVPGPGLAEHDADQDWWGGFCSVTRQLLQKTAIDPTQIASVGCSGIGPCMLPVDAAGRALRPAVLYGVDTRSKDEIVELTQRYGAEFIMRHSGMPLTTQAVGPKVLWLARHEPEIFSKAARIVGCPTYLVQRLTGACVVDHYGAANYAPFYDVEKLAWDRAQTSDICSPDLLPEARWTCEVAGQVHEAAASQTGLSAGTPVIVGTVDAAAEATSVGVLGHGDLMAMYGTSVFFIQVVPELQRDVRRWSAPYLFPGTWAAMGAVSTGGALTHWFRRELTQLDDREAGFAILQAEAERSPPGSNGLIALPYFSGERTPLNDPLARGMFFGLDLTHTRADMYRSLLEGVAHASRHNLDMFDQGFPASAIYAVGGGVNNALWMQASVDIAGKPQRIRQQTVGAAMGSAFLAGIGVGVFQSGDIERINPVAREIVPRASCRARYDKDHRIFLQLYESTRHLMAELGGAPR
ncbi:MAG: FGGY-family carbohydrate kinase [Rhodoferax sp.]|nr:FGGY-family carbohydrate kinase [Rhodoferax sp.]MCB2005188.1 FGGY-family carbohydrate kinase [Rhodoferax sp.]MCP5260954.1 FGGY-family carbohydrate kinase [Rhodoferax sp.]